MNAQDAATLPGQPASGHLEPDPVLVLVGARVKALRLQLGLTQAVLAEGSGIPRPNLSRIERGLENLSVRRLSRLAEALGVSARDLLS